MSIPEGWVVAKLAEVVSLKTGPFGSSLHQSDYVPGGIPIINPMHIVDGRILPTEKHRVSDATAKRLGEFRVREGDIVLGRRGEMGRAAVVGRREASWLCGTGSLIVRPASNVSPNYLRQFLSSDAVVRYLLHASVGSTMANLNQDVLLGLNFLLPPFDEQKRIEDKVDELVSELDAGVAELKAAQAKLTQYRQSLLKAAVEGALTADWRAERAKRGEATETGTQLLERILAERRKRWEAKQLARFKEQGKTPPKGWQDKYPEPVKPDTTDLPQLPDGWVWASLEQLSEIQGGIQKQPARAPVKNKFPFLRVANVARGRLVLDEIHEIELFEGEPERLILEMGDLLIVEGNGSLSEIGRCALWDGSIPNAVHQNHLIRSRPILMQSAFVEALLNSLWGINQMTKLAATTSGLYTLSVGKISQITLPVPPLEEQEQIVNQLSAAVVELGNQLLATETALRQAAAQRKNILKSAFSGQLVPQDPNEEPANVLLERIRAERESATKPKAARKTRTPKVSHA